MTLDDRKIFPDIFHPVSLPTEEPLWVLFDWSAISLDIQLRSVSVPYFTTNSPTLESLDLRVRGIQGKPLFGPCRRK